MKHAALLWLSVLALGACTRASNRKPQSVESAPELLQRAGLEITPLENYVFPVVGGHLGSAWCQCRNVGTSPHIGQDYLNLPGHIFSVAISDGVVTAVNFTGPGCGWEVYFEDSQGALWRYLHLNKPDLVAGQVLPRGHIIGTHAQYPTASCGTGPHLHLERHTAGLLPGKISGRACQNGFRSCNFDPATVLKDKHVIATLAEASAMAKSPRPFVVSGAAATPAPGTNTLPTPPAQSKTMQAPMASSVPETLPACSSVQPAPEAVATTPTTSAAPTNMDSWIDALQGSVSTQAARDGRTMIFMNPWNLESDSGEATSDNICGMHQDAQIETCVVSWELQVMLNTGAWVKVAGDQGVRNKKIELLADAAYCMPEGFTPKYRLVATTESGRTIVSEGEAQ